MVAAGLSVVPERRFPPPWTVEETDACFIVHGQALAYVYCEDEPGRRSAPRCPSPSLNCDAYATPDGFCSAWALTNKAER
jgi:hypothetical protein